MCKSIAEGGRRCVSHTRKAYRQAMLPVFAGEVLTEAIESKLLLMATRYASTGEGKLEIEADLERADLERSGSSESLRIDSFGLGLASPILERALIAGTREKERVDEIEARIRMSKSTQKNESLQDSSSDEANYFSYWRIDANGETVRIDPLDPILNIDGSYRTDSIGRMVRLDPIENQSSQTVWEEDDEAVDPIIGPILYAKANKFEPFLEHDGSINDQDTPGDYLKLMKESNCRFDETDPMLFGVYGEEGNLTASVFDGNHRLILMLEDSPEEEIPYRIVRNPSNSFPGFDYNGELG